MLPHIKPFIKKSGMDEDRARYLDIEQMVKHALRDAERVYVNGILQNGLESGNLLLVTSGCSAASNWQPGPHAVSTIVCSSWNPGCC